MQHTLSLFTALLLAAACAAASERVVWQIGASDRNYREFAIAGSYSAYASRFGATPPVFVVGKSAPARDWPFIQPGPTDRCAYSRRHPFTIRFDLADEPRGVFRRRATGTCVSGNMSGWKPRVRWWCAILRCSPM